MAHAKVQEDGTLTVDWMCVPLTFFAGTPIRNISSGAECFKWRYSATVKPMAGFA